MPFFALLTAALIVAKVCNFTDISWWFVLSPILAGFIITLAVIGGAAYIASKSK
jgi:hypothetical protein